MPAPGLPTNYRAIEQRTQALGRALLAAADAYRPSPTERTEDWLLTHAVAHDAFRSRLLRYMDVLASLDHDASGREAKRLAREYFDGDLPGVPRPIRWLARLARNEAIPAPVVGQAARRSAALFARRFITRPEALDQTLHYLAQHGRYPSFDVLGEAVLSDAEANAYVERYLALIAQLRTDPAAGARTAGGAPALQLSLKLSSLTAQFTPADAAGTVARVRAPLEAIARAAAAAGIGLTVDAEQYAYRDITWEAFRRTFARGTPLGGWPDAGIVVQAYLRDADAHAAEVISFARERGTPFQVRLVKGAYWDAETIAAAASHWTPPVFGEKGATDASFERLVDALLGADPSLHLAVASHNARSHAYAEAVAETRGLAIGAVEHQTLFRTAEGTSRALASLGWMARDYVPVGELLPGMAYLVRRVLENSSQAGFLLQSRSGADPDDLLHPPAPPAGESALPASPAFEPAPAARWFDAAFRTAFEDALQTTRARWGEHIPLTIGDTQVTAAGTHPVHSPSHPGDPPVGTVDLADGALAQRAAEAARLAQPAWAAMPVATRAAVLRRAATLLEDRAHEFAAWVVHEGGRDRADAFAEVEEAIDYLRYYAEEGARMFGTHGEHLSPRGVVAVIPPWNFSLAIPCGMTVAALMCGNAVVLKPATQTPLIAARLTALLHESGIPRAVLTCLPGSGASAGRVLVTSPDIAMVAFTGSRDVGTWMHEAVSAVRPLDGHIKAITAELGGKNPILVFADADLDEAVEGITRSAFGHANQKCSAASRVLIAEPIFTRLRDRLIEAARSLAVGPADEPGTRVNPIIDATAAERLQRAAERARAECEVLFDAFSFPADPAAPRTTGPLIVQVPTAHALDRATATEELFGPILVLIPFHDAAEAYRIANGTVYGLTAGVFSRSPATIEEASRAIEAGTVYVNRAITGARVGIEPFGGMKHSGTGPKVGSADTLWAFTRRTDVPADVDGDAAPSVVDGEHARAAAQPGDAVITPMDHTAQPAQWDVPVPARIEVVERAAALLGHRQHPREAAALLAAAQAARRELAVPQPLVPVAGQHTELRYETPRGRGVLVATGPGGATWLAAALLAGNAVEVFERAGEGPHALAPAIAALREAGVPASVLSESGPSSPALLARASAPDIAFAATDGGPAWAAALYARLGPTHADQHGLKTLLSTLDGPQPGEAGFLRRFALPKVVAVRTVRHGADLGFTSGEPSA